MFIKEVSAKAVKDSRGEETIFVKIKTNVGEFSATAPNGKSKGKHEAKSYKKNLADDIKELNELG
jgi:enolase